MWHFDIRVLQVSEPKLHSSLLESGKHLVLDLRWRALNPTTCESRFPLAYSYTPIPPTDQKDLGRLSSMSSKGDVFGMTDMLECL